MTQQTSPHRVLIIAAGQGSRLCEHTRNRPKCMVEVNGASILTRQLEAFRANDITDIHIVRGYLAEKLIVPGATYYLNSDYRSNNILFSAMVGLAAFDQPLLTSYSDIIFTSEVVKTLLDTPGDIVLTIDKDWASSYQGRENHPVEQAELAIVNEEQQVQEVGKWVGPTHAAGEFIGLAKYSAKGAQLVQEYWNQLLQSTSADSSFRHASPFRMAYLADLFEHLINNGVTVNAAFIHGGWREIDTVEDLERVSLAWTV